MSHRAKVYDQTPEPIFEADVDDNERWQRGSRKAFLGWCAWCGESTTNQRFCNLTCKLDHDADVAAEAAA